MLKGFVAVLDLAHALEDFVVVLGLVCALEEQGQDGLVDWKELSLVPGLEVLILLVPVKGQLL